MNLGSVVVNPTVGLIRYEYMVFNLTGVKKLKIPPLHIVHFNNLPFLPYYT